MSPAFSTTVEMSSNSTVLMVATVPDVDGKLMYK